MNAYEPSAGRLVATPAPAALSAAVDLGGTKVSVALGDLGGNLLAESTAPTDARGGTHVVDQIAASIGELASRLGSPLSDLHSVVVGVPGAVQPETAWIRAAPNIEGIGNVDIPAMLKDRLGASVLIENDVNLAALGEQCCGRGAGVANFVFIALGTGIGMGIVADGRLLRGARGAAGEIGYLPLGGDPYDSRGFAAGTFEAAAGSVAICGRYVGYGGPRGASVRDVFAALEAGDAAARRTVEETARLVAPAIAAVGAMLDPELVILGGSIGARQELIDAVRHYLPRCSSEPPLIEASKLGSRAGLIGALSVAAGQMRGEAFGAHAPSA